MAEAPPGDHGAALAFLSDLHEQVELQLSATADPQVRTVLEDIRSRITSAGLTITILATIRPPSAPG